jgi:quinol monooxygenase YgiN
LKALPTIAAMTSTYLFISFEARPEATHDFATLLDQVRQELPSIPGCRGVRVFTHAEHAQRFSVLEEWDCAASHQAHINQVVASGEWERIRTHLSVDPTSFFLRDS